MANAQRIRYVKGILHSADASTAVAVPLFLQGGQAAAITPASNERLRITSAFYAHAAGGDCHLFMGADGTPGSGETLLRSTAAANGGAGWYDGKHTMKGGSAERAYFVTDTAGVVDVIINGYLEEVD